MFFLKRVKDVKKKTGQFIISSYSCMVMRYVYSFVIQFVDFESIYQIKLVWLRMHFTNNNDAI